MSKDYGLPDMMLPLVNVVCADMTSANITYYHHITNYMIVLYMLTRPLLTQHTSERQWVLMVEPSILNVFIKIKHHFVKINLQSSTESYQPITFANRHQVWSIDILAKTLQ